METKGRVLVVDDDGANRKVVAAILQGEGYEVAEAPDAFLGLDRLDRFRPHAVILDIKMPGMDGLALLRDWRQRGVDVPVLILTGHGDQFTAQHCLATGADAFLEKPPQRAELLLAVHNAVARGLLLEENRSLKEELTYPPLLGFSPVMEKLREEIARVASARATVLIMGESGTGKELVARRIHELSPRQGKPFIRVNCAAIPEELIESELFGHEKGAFTGAVRRQVGKFVQADRGTIFLDEVGDMSERTQAKVLRVLQDGEVEPVGAGEVRRLDVRVIAATNKDLQAEVARGRFREDLFFRLSVVVLRTPPLREHPEDIPELVAYFTERACAEYNRHCKRWSAQALAQLSAYHWPGNVRELKNLVERMVIMELADEIRAVDLPLSGQRQPEGELAAIFVAPTLADFHARAEREYLRRMLARHHWNVAATARAIQTPRSNLYKKIEAYRLKREE